jgi:phosphatidylglycerol:prolipoprotein diacylglycerol transferase
VHPILIDLGRWNLPFLGETHLFLPTYGAVFATAVLLAWWWFSRRARSLDVDGDLLFNAGFYSLLAGIFGAKALLIVLDWKTYLAHPAELWATLRLGGVLLGGVIAGVLVFSLYARRHGMPLLSLADAAAAPLALAQSVGRLGCFSAGCCWGVQVSPDNPLAIIFRNPIAHEQTGVPLNVPLFPVQLLQLLHDAVLCLALTFLWRRRLRPSGTVFWIYVLWYSIGRGIIEFWRGDSHRGLFLHESLSTSQLLSLIGASVAAAMLIHGAIRRKRHAAP